MAQVDFYEVEVKYSGNITDYTVEELYNMARAAQERRGNFEPSYTKTMTRREAKKYDGDKSILTCFPCNHIAIVQYSYITEEA